LRMIGGRRDCFHRRELEHKVFGQPLLLPCQFYCFLLLFCPQIIGAQGNGLLSPALGVGLPIGGLGLLESV
jgi:hypothetical protein